MEFLDLDLYNNTNSHIQKLIIKASAAYHFGE